MACHKNETCFTSVARNAQKIKPMIVEIPDREYKTEEVVEILKMLDATVGCFSKSTFGVNNLWPTVSQIKVDNVVAKYMRCVEHASLPPTGEKWWPPLNPEATVAVRIRILYAIDVLEELSYSMSYTRSEMFRYLRQIMTDHWRQNGFVWLVEKKAGLPLFWTENT